MLLNLNWALKEEMVLLKFKALRLKKGKALVEVLKCRSFSGFNSKKAKASSLIDTAQKPLLLSGFENLNSGFG